MKKTIDTLVEDIYKFLDPLTENKKIKVTEKQIDEFGKSMAQAFKHWALPEPRSSEKLRMSNVGKPARQLWFDFNAEEKPEKLEPHLLIKFLYGHLLEEVLLFLVSLSGHKVENQQKLIEVSGVKGHMDCTIDGEVVDVKTASGYGFRKFKDGTLPEDDAFGYMAQLTGYETAEGTNGGAFLALNKESGELALFKPDNFDKPNIKKKIKDVKNVIAIDRPPDFCYNIIPEGKLGNMKLPRECTYCRHKFECHKDSNEGQGLRVFKYSKGLVYMTQTPNPPRVDEIKYERKKS